ncbi:MAG: HEAT repeat domain-containing protein [Bacteroidales bacterium]
MRQRWLACWMAAGLVLTAASASGQTKPVPPAEASQMAAGWAALNQGDAAKAASIASGALAQNPRSGPAFVLLVAARTSRSATEGLSAYEQALGSRRLDDAYTLRIVALAMVREAARNSAAPDAQREAIKALTAEGDTDTLLLVARNASAGGPFETQLLAQLGSEPAVKTLIAQLKSGQGYRPMLIEALANSHSPLAVAPLVELLKESGPEVRAAAADALGKLGATSAVDALKPLVDDPVFPVRLAAASALLRLHDMTGMTLLRQLEASEHPMVRVTALEALSVDAGQAWVSAALSLLQDPDPQVRLAAARLAAPYDPAAVQRVVEGLMTDSNLAIRDAAAKLYVEQVATDFAALRRLMRSPDGAARIRSAGRILGLTR